MSIFEIVPLIIAFLLIAVVILQQRKIDKLTRLLTDLKINPQNPASSPGTDLINQAQKKAQEIITAAELAALKLTTEKKMEGSIFDQETHKKLSESSQKLEDLINKHILDYDKKLNQDLAAEQQKQEEFLNRLNNLNFQFEEKLNSAVQAKINELLLNFEVKLTQFFSQAKDQSTQAINLEIKSARELIENYKAQQLGIVDENIVAVLEQTINLVLKKKLTLKDQLDLVYEALEKAKVEKFLV